MGKAYTDIEQSKKLAKILPPESADMWWREVSYGFYHIEAEILKGWYDVPPKGIPCWSLAALLSILPKGTRLLKSATDDTYHCDCPKGNIDKWFDNPIDAAFEIVCWLKENNKI